MSLINRIAAILQGMGTSVVNDAKNKLEGTALTGTQTTNLSGLKTFTKGKCRVKIYGASGASATVTKVQLVASDGTTYVQVGLLHPATAIALGTNVAGTQITAAGTTTANSPVLSASGSPGPFTPAMAGQPVQIAGAGAGGAALITTIAGFQNSNQVTLAVPAQTAVAGTAVVTQLSSSYATAGVLGTSVGGVDFVADILTDLQANQLSILTILGAGNAFMDVDFAGVG